MDHQGEVLVNLPLVTGDACFRGLGEKAFLFHQFL